MSLHCWVLTSRLVLVFTRWTPFHANDVASTPCAIERLTCLLRLEGRNRAECEIDARKVRAHKRSAARNAQMRSRDALATTASRHSTSASSKLTLHAASARPLLLSLSRRSSPNDERSRNHLSARTLVLFLSQPKRCGESPSPRWYSPVYSCGERGFESSKRRWQQP